MIFKQIPLVLIATSLVASGVAAQDNPTQKAPELSPAQQIMSRSLETYNKARSYQGSWTYTVDRGGQKQKMLMEIKSKGQAQLYFRISLAPGSKPLQNADAVPEMMVVVDGKTAYFVGITSNKFFKVPLPKDGRCFPLMFFPQIPAAGNVQTSEEKSTDGRASYILLADRVGGGTSKIEIDKETYRFRRVLTEEMLGPIKLLSSIVMEKEVVDADIPDSAFVFKAPRGATEEPAPPGAEAMFGRPTTGPKPDGKP